MTMPTPSQPIKLETKLIELPHVVLPPEAKQGIPISFAQPTKLLEIQHSQGVVIVSVRVGDVTFEADAYANEVVPAAAPVIIELQNLRKREMTVRAGIFIEQEAIVPVAPVAPDTSAAPVTSAVPVAAASAPAHVVPPAGIPFVPGPNGMPPPPPGGASHFSLPGQTISVTTPAVGQNGTHGGMPIMGGAGPGMQPPAAGTVQSFELGNQKVTVTSPAQPRGGHPASQIIAAVIDPRVSEGPATVTVGTDEVAILCKRFDAENMLKILRGAVLHPGYCVPLEGAVRRALGEA